MNNMEQLLEQPAPAEYNKGINLFGEPTTTGSDWLKRIEASNAYWECFHAKRESWTYRAHVSHENTCKGIEW